MVDHEILQNEAMEIQQTARPDAIQPRLAGLGATRQVVECFGQLCVIETHPQKGDPVADLGVAGSRRLGGPKASAQLGDNLGRVAIVFGRLVGDLDSETRNLLHALPVLPDRRRRRAESPPRIVFEEIFHRQTRIPVEARRRVVAQARGDPVLLDGIEIRLTQTNLGETVHGLGDRTDKGLQLAVATVEKQNVRPPVGLPQTGRIGFEIFDKTNFGATDFTEHINYKRAIEGELERSLRTIQAIEQARVHVTFAKNSVFLENKEPAKGSVMVKLRPGATMDPKQSAAIAHLVASAVEGLRPDQVSIIDMRGNLLSRP
ncbi:MAG: flagellar M-ring protein FliF, partial [Verrucomicrobiae bacterium]|nr:flagellar M-ring protein FliF [Verrucomicrobiae bacterium]